MLSGTDEMKYIQSFNTVSDDFHLVCRLDWEPMFATETMADLNFLQVCLAAVKTHIRTVEVFVVRSNNHSARSTLLTTQLVVQLKVLYKINIRAGEVMNHP